MFTFTEQFIAYEKPNLGISFYAPFTHFNNNVEIYKTFFECEKPNLESNILYSE